MPGEGGTAKTKAERRCDTAANWKVPAHSRIATTPHATLRCPVAYHAASHAAAAAAVAVQEALPAAAAAADEEAKMHCQGARGRWGGVGFRALALYGAFSVVGEGGLSVFVV